MKTVAKSHEQKAIPKTERWGLECLSYKLLLLGILNSSYNFSQGLLWSPIVVEYRVGFQCNFAKNIRFNWNLILSWNSISNDISSQHRELTSSHCTVTVVEMCLLSHHFCYCSKMNTTLLKFGTTNEKNHLNLPWVSSRAYISWERYTLYRGKIKKCRFYQRDKEKKITEKQSTIYHWKRSFNSPHP